ncbi:MAG TPA: 23S rRNA (guanosine(2251)-2'-O)-methyltransferase RlmB [Vicinamibacterales bacterium]|nr:23S rRNA (guanosine(2251)-2'-O)-methyltransferase RlmB [Vicinamibacterales bacterium]
MVIFGINPVLEALRAGGVTRLRVSARADARLNEVLAQAAARRLGVERVEAAVLDRAARGGVHQGVVADVDVRDYSMADLLRPPHAAPHTPLIVVLDGIEDPHNAGAIIRTADAVGADGVVRQARHAAALDGVVAKASAGAIAHVKVATVVNIARAIEELRQAGVWSVGLAHDAPEMYTAHDFRLPTALVLGAEGTGLRRLVRERCDRLVRIPMRGGVSSLNVSVAAGVVLYEAVRQRNVRS